MSDSVPRHEFDALVSWATKEIVRLNHQQEIGGELIETLEERTYKAESRVLELEDLICTGDWATITKEGIKLQLAKAPTCEECGALL